MVHTRSGLNVEPETHIIYCHQTRHQIIMPIGQFPDGLLCTNCPRFWCEGHLQSYDESTRGSPSEWKCYYCTRCCTCSECKRLGHNIVADDEDVNTAFAVEGQVGKRKRVASMRHMAKKVKIMEMELTRLHQEANIQAKVAEQYEDLKIRFNQEAKERKELYNKMQELRGNIRVYARCRPLNSEEIAQGASLVFDFEGSKDGELQVKSNVVAVKKNFKFDSVFSPEATQAEVCEDASTFARSVLDGYNTCIFAYGQTGTGKTFTMEGTNENRGVNFRTLEELFRVIDERKDQIRYEISVCGLEVYNDHVHDLLFPRLPGAAPKRVEIRQYGEVIHVPDLVEKQVSNLSDVWEVLKSGSKARAVGSTNANEHSSRSHCMHCVMVKAENLLNGERTRSKLWLVDLAGSERCGKTAAQGERLTEAGWINKSISALGDVIAALADNRTHIPYRNSKLTHLLHDSLGGASKTLMFVQISPHQNDLSESLSSLEFASRVRGIELGAAKKQIVRAEVPKHKQMMKEKDLQIKNLEMKLKETELKNRNLQDKVKELESQLARARKPVRQQVDTKLAEQKQQHHNQPESTLSRPPDRSKQRQPTKQHHPATT